MNLRSTILSVISSLFVFFMTGADQSAFPLFENTGRERILNDQGFDISYSIEPFYDINIFRFIVVMEFTGEKNGETRIILPNEFRGQKNIDGIKFLKPLTENTTIIDTEVPDQKIIKYMPGRQVRIYYQIEEIRDDDIELGNQYMVTLNRTYFHILSETFFILPAWDWYKEWRIRIGWNHIPSNWNLANSFGINEKIQNIKTSLAKFSYSIFTGGDFRISKKNIDNYPVLLSIRGKWNFSDEQFLELVKTILKEERDFWDDHNFPYFLITVLPIEGRGDQIGLQRTNSYSFFLSKNRIVDLRLKRLIAHEFFHTWLGDKIKFAEPEQLVYWFKEGFCDYYTRLLLLRSGLITLPEYVEDYNRILYAYNTSPVRNEKNERVVNEFWSNFNIMKLPYMRGDIIAHNLNTIIINNTGGSKSLDDLMKNLFKRSLTESLLVSNGSLSALIRYYADEQALSDIMKSLNSGVPLKSHPEALGPCFKMEIESYRKLWLIGELFEIPSYVPKSENSVYDPKCIEWFLYR
ncbi:MAG TPA: M1 family aminopeptidase [Melioribacteraceae bacterium]|nr:M1 family aminopeptidase [Melioribacteraceae bacterium]